MIRTMIKIFFIYLYFHQIGFVSILTPNYFVNLVFTKGTVKAATTALPKPKCSTPVPPPPAPAPSKT